MTEYEEEYEEEEETTLGSALTTQFGEAPWYVSSVAVHCILFLVLLLIPVTVSEQREKNIKIVTDMLEDIPDDPEDIVEPIVEPKVDKIVESEVIVDEPIITVQDVEISDHMETDENMETSTAKGDPDNMSDLDSDFVGTPALMGVGKSGGSGGGGRYGFRTGGGKNDTTFKNGGNRKSMNADRKSVV